MRAVGVLVIIISGLLLSAGLPASASPPTVAATIGPMQINPVGHPHLCWQATGNGAPIALATCDSGLQNQLWSLTPDGVLMNGIGYCLEALPGHAHGTPLYIDFARQCGGSRGQVWTYADSTGQLSSAGTCAGLGGPVSAGAEIVRASCGHTPRWSLGYSHVTLTAGPGSGPAGGSYTASATLTNAASAQTAYGVTATFTLPPGLPANALHGTGAQGTAFRCTVQTLTCTGTLPAGTSARIDLSGQVPTGAAAGASYQISARAAIHGTSQQPGTTRTTAVLKVAIGAAAPASAPATGGVVMPLSMPLLALIVGAFLLAGGLLVGLAIRRRPARSRASARSHAPVGWHAPSHSHAAAHSRGPTHSRGPASSPAYPGAQINAGLPVNIPPQADARHHPDAQPPAYEGRRRRTAPGPLASAPEPRTGLEPLARPGRHHAHR